MGLTDRLIRVERHLFACDGLDGEAPQAIADFFVRHNRAGGQGISAFREVEV